MVGLRYNDDYAGMNACRPISPAQQIKALRLEAVTKASHNSFSVPNIFDLTLPLDSKESNKMRLFQMPKTTSVQSLGLKAKLFILVV